MRKLCKRVVLLGVNHYAQLFLQLGIVFDSEENDTLAQLAQSIVRQLAS